MLAVSNLDLGKRELQNAKIQNLSSAPGSPVAGQIYYDSTLGQFGCYNAVGTAWIYLTPASSANVSKASNASAANVMQVSNSTDKALVDFTSAGGIPKVTAGGVVSIATAGTDYSTPSATETFTNKTFSATGTGNAITNLATSNFGAGVIDTDTTLAGNSDTKLATQKATKAYVDAIAQGLKWKEPVRAATTANGALATAYENADVIDGVTLATGDRILLKDQTAGAENGIYTVNASGAPTRATDADTAAEISQMVVSVREGTVNADQAYLMTNNGTVTLGTTSLVYVDFVKASVPAATTAVAGKVTLATLAEAEAKADTSKAVVSADLANFPLKRTATIGDGSSTAIAVTDNLGTLDKIAICRDAASNAQILVDITYASNTTTFTFAVAPASNAYKVVIIG